MSLAYPQQLLSGHSNNSAHPVRAETRMRHVRPIDCQPHVSQRVHQHVSSRAVSAVQQQQQHCSCLPVHSCGLVRHSQKQSAANRRASSKSSAVSVTSRAAAAAAAVDQAPVSSSSSSSSRAPEMCVIVDENNNVVGAATRYETVSKRLLGRGSYVLVFNEAGQLFVSQRSHAKDCYPGCLDVTISGVVNQGEEYMHTAVRELQEEIGVPPEAARQQLQQLFIFPYQDSVCHIWGCAFRIVWDGPVAFRDAEVEWGRFMDVGELQQQLEQSPDKFTPVGRHILGLYLAVRTK